MVSGVQVEEIVLVFLLGVQGWIWCCFLPQNTQIWRWCSGVQILGLMSGVMNQCWVFDDLPGEVNLFFCYASTESLGVRLTLWVTSVCSGSGSRFKVMPIGLQLVTQHRVQGLGSALVRSG